MKSPSIDSAASILTNGNVLIAGELYGGDYLSSAELYNSSTETWTITDNMSQPR
ncbi:unnamed protein product, partial [Rotaria sp. Silwood2]